MQEKIERNLRIYQDKLSGMTYRQLMEKYKLSQQTLVVIVMRHKDRETNI